tara:strand:- start:89 stop:448 length:360 start_codon:yes stop_codon:yes gene_type:complete
LTISFCEAKSISGQGAVLRILNKVTTEKFYYIMPLSRKLELSNADIVALKCYKIENEENSDEIVLIKHISNDSKKSKDFLGWIFKSSKYLSSPVNSIFDIQLEQCLLSDPIFMKKVRKY